MHSVARLHLLGSNLGSGLPMWNMHVYFPCACMDFLWALELPPTFKKLFIKDSKLFVDCE